MADFFYRLNGVKIKKAYVLLHSYEVMAFFIVLAAKTESPAVLGICIGMLTHFTADILCWRAYFYSYSLIYRMIMKFEMKRIFNVS